MATSKTSLLDEIFVNLLLMFSGMFLVMREDGYFVGVRRVICCWVVYTVCSCRLRGRRSHLGSQRYFC